MLDLCLISRYSNNINQPNRRGKMTKAQKISEMIINEFAKTGSIKEAFDRVMGEGAYDKLAGEIYDDLNKKNG